MVHRFVKMQFAAKALPVIKPLFDQIAPKVRGFEGCTYLDIFFDLRQRGTIITYSHWHSESQLEAYRHSEVFRRFWSQVKPHFSKPAEAWSTDRFVHMP